MSCRRATGSTIESESDARPIAERDGQGAKEDPWIHGSEASRRLAERVSHLNTGSRGLPVATRERERKRKPTGTPEPEGCGTYASERRYRTAGSH